ncbi:hypothetical protein MGU_02392 [Metarhizium guizhouense ARSEF 977]|uniref:Uncharacterized protein n=1 Tax=Metarhizium guizhouense (strain ARSEF 977) TaxID=1276136 RepID=A0A0B4GSX8_METGA|nr:hypothetical protein MGU_02392 [Metarhizium guizhouense ARSEF 977]
MEQQDPQDDLSPLADLTSAAQERLNYARAQGSRRLSRQAVLNRSLSFGGPNFEPVVPSPLGQPSWNQESVPSPESPVEQDSDDDGPRLDQGYDKEPVVLHPAGLERVSPEVWARWYVEQRDDGSAQAAGVTGRSASPIQLLSESSDPDFTNTSFPFFSPQEPIGSPSRSPAASTSRPDSLPLDASGTDPPRLPSPSPTTSNTSGRWTSINAPSTSVERGASLGNSIRRPASPAPDGSSEDLSWLLQHLPQGSDSGVGSY